MVTTTRQEREAARQDLWQQRQSCVRAEWQVWLKSNVDVKAPFQPALRGYAEVTIEPAKKAGRGNVLTLPSAVWRRFDKLAYRPKMPAADEKHQADLGRIGKRLYALIDAMQDQTDRVVPSTTAAERTAMLEHLALMAARYRGIRGGYYIRHPLQNKPGVEVKHPEDNAYTQNWKARLRHAERSGMHELVWACELALQGLPEQFTDFFIEPLFVLVRTDRTKTRMVNIRTANGELFGFDSRHPFGPENRPLELSPEFSVQPLKLREWLQKHASGVWGAGGKGGGEKELQALLYDLNKGFAWDEVFEVAQVGWHDKTGAYFYGDMASGPDGVPLVPDKTGCYRIGGKRWMLADRDAEGMDWQIPLPMMRPELVDKWKVKRVAKEEAFELFRTLSMALRKVVGGQDGLMALGCTVSYFAGPEVFKDRGGFGGLWMHGQRGSGKNSIGQILVAVHGFGVRALNLQSGTTAALENAAAQFRFLPILLDEFQTELKDGVLFLVKQMFDQTKTPKIVGRNGGGRIPGTAPIVMGQATSNDSATKSRYPHILIAKENRKDPDGSAYRWLKKNREELHKIGRCLLEHRTQFARSVMRHLAEWLDSDAATEIGDDRARWVHGVSYAAFCAAYEVLGGEAKEFTEFRQWLLNEASRSEGESRETVELEKFWQKVEGCFVLGGFGRTREELARFFRVEVVPSADGEARPCPPGLPDGSTQGGAWMPPLQGDPMGRDERYTVAASPNTRAVWLRLRLHIAYGPLFEALERHARGQGKNLPLQVVDVAHQMKAISYYVPPARTASGKEGGKHHFGSNGSCRYWGLELDAMPTWGYCPASDEHVASGYGAGGDPRLGPFYQICAKMLAPAGSV